MARISVHIVLAPPARAPGGHQRYSPCHRAGSSCPNAEGEKGERNGVNCGSRNTRWHPRNRDLRDELRWRFRLLIGPPKTKGLNAMFTFMNTAPVLGLHLQGLGAC